MPQAAAFDVDGTLIDFVDLQAKARQDAFRDYGHEIAFNELWSWIGEDGDQLMPVFLSKEEQDAKGDHVAGGKGCGRGDPCPACVRATRTEFGRPKASMRFET